MKNKMFNQIKLRDYYNDCKDGKVRFYFPEHIEGINNYRHTIVVCPGGGYNHTSLREGEVVALKLLSMGFNAVVVDYTVGEGCYPYPINELTRTLEYLDNKKEELGIKSLSVMGFSAGGHLASYVGYTTNIKLNAVILGYPVITMKEFTHQGSKHNLLCNHTELIDEMSVENKINANSPRTFLFTTVEDQSVPFENTLLLVNALRKNNVSFELHAFESGKHGLSLANDLVATSNEGINCPFATWPYFLEKFMKK